jgi:hypothetical protein
MTLLFIAPCRILIDPEGAGKSSMADVGFSRPEAPVALVVGGVCVRQVFMKSLHLESYGVAETAKGQIKVMSCHQKNFRAN